MPGVSRRIRTMAFAAISLVATTTCQVADVLKPSGLEDVVLSFASDSILVVAAPVRPEVGVSVNGAPLANARWVLASADTDVVAVRGDTLVPKRRGRVTLTLSRTAPSAA